MARLGQTLAGCAQRQGVRLFRLQRAEARLFDQAGKQEVAVKVLARAEGAFGDVDDPAVADQDRPVQRGVGQDKGGVGQDGFGHLGLPVQSGEW